MVGGCFLLVFLFLFGQSEEVTALQCSGGLPSSSAEVCSEASNEGGGITVNCFATDTQAQCDARLFKLAGEANAAKGKKCSPGCVPVVDHAPGSNPTSSSSGSWPPVTAGGTRCVKVNFACPCVEEELGENELQGKYAGFCDLLA